MPKPGEIEFDVRIEKTPHSRHAGHALEITQHGHGWAKEDLTREQLARISQEIIRFLGDEPRTGAAVFVILDGTALTGDQATDAIATGKVEFCGQCSSYGQRILHDHPDRVAGS